MRAGHMVFASITFLFLFLPLVLAGHFVLPRALRNLFLLLVSLLFYAWGEAFYVLLMLASTAANYLFGLWVDRTRETGSGRVVLAFAVIANVAGLAAFKYANFFTDTLSVPLSQAGLAPIKLSPVHLPIAISFFTFHAMSYVIDIYRRDAEVQRGPINIALYIAFFPQLIAGPIIRYHDVASQLVERTITREGFAYGIRRFIIGLGKKVLIANVVAGAADGIFAVPGGQLSAGLAWLGVVCYTLQIYFDFSGYSDMAIGLARMFGFCFLENFNYPYISGSIREFWRRWHISLSNWFRDYLYIPLGGNRRSPARTYFNLVTVFFLCGLWHGASWTFVIWGLYHGLFLVMERIGLEQRIRALWAPVRHAYALLAVMVGWVLFRADTLPQAMSFLRAMVGFGTGDGVRYHVWLYLNGETALAILVGIVASVPLAPVLARLRGTLAARMPAPVRGALESGAAYGGVVALTGVFVVSVMWLSAGTYNPFIYFRF